MSLESRPQSPERESPRGLEPLGQIPPSDKFVCTYGGPFAQNLFLDRPQVDKFLALAALDGRVLLKESKVRRPKSVPDGINPDGSITGRRSLMWGERVEVEDKATIARGGNGPLVSLCVVRVVIAANFPRLDGAGRCEPAGRKEDGEREALHRPSAAIIRRNRA